MAVNDETDMLDSLTGIPLSEDEILFAVPVCAPYATLLNYKFKGELVTPAAVLRVSVLFIAFCFSNCF